MKKLNILIADDHTLIRDSLTQIAVKQEFTNSVETVKNGNEALQRLSENNFDILTTDVAMPDMDGIQLSKKVRKQYPEIKILVVTQHTDFKISKQLLNEKVKVESIVLKINENNEIETALQKIAQGETYYSPEINQIIIGNLKNEKRKISQFDEIRLTKREKEVLKLIAEEHTDPEIGEKLHISPHTAETHRRNLISKFGVKNAVGLVRKAVEYGFIA